MSWAAHNVEAYDKVLRDGVRSKLVASLNDNGFEEHSKHTLEALVEILQTDFRKAFDELVSSSLAQVSDAEADYHASHWGQP